MRKLLLSLVIFGGFVFFGIPEPIRAADFCTSDLASVGFSCVTSPNDCDAEISSEIKNTVDQILTNKKQGAFNEGKFGVTGVCENTGICCKKKNAAGATTPTENTNSNGEVCGPVCQWIKNNPDYKAPDGYVENGGIIPACAFSGQCRNTNDLVDVFINQGKKIFGLIGAVALVAFVYGGFLMVFSFGSSDKIQQGKDVMVAAVIGIIIVFSAYLAVNFILSVLGVSAEFNAIK